MARRNKPGWFCFGPPLQPHTPRPSLRPETKPLAPRGTSNLQKGCYTNNYVRGPWRNIWDRFDANNHVLYPIAAECSVRALHISELSLRLPTLLAGFLFVIWLHRTLVKIVSSVLVRTIAFGGLCLAPLLLDFSVAARGYVLGIALLVWAMNLFFRHRYHLAGVAVGLAVATTLNLAYAAVGLALAPLVLERDKVIYRLRRGSCISASAALAFLAVWFANSTSAKHLLLLLRSSNDR